jgi:dihydrodipicolinate synthase/N-acetylneuraminate lyase
LRRPKEAVHKEGSSLKISGSLPVIPTPFRDNRIDFDSLLRLFDHLFPELEGYTLCGSTGEAPSLTMDERMELMKFAARNTPSSKTIVVGLTHTSLEDMTRLARSAQELGIHAGLVPCPYYFPNSFPWSWSFFAGSIVHPGWSWCSTTIRSTPRHGLRQTSYWSWWTLASI